MPANVSDKAGQPGGAAGLSAGKLVVLQALIALLHPALEGRVSQDEIATRIGRKRASVGNTLSKLKNDGWIKVESPKSWGGANKYSIPQVTYNFVAEHLGGFEAIGDTLPDCFRTSDLNNAGRLWMAAPKGQELTWSDIKPLALCGRATTLKHLAALSELTVPAVTMRPNPHKARAYLYTFHELSDEQQLAIQADLSLRLPRWRPRTEAASIADHERRKGELAAKVGPAAYPHKVREILDLSAPDKSHIARGVSSPCWIYRGPLSHNGYGDVIGVRSPGVKAHRITYHQLVGPVPRGQELHHMCRRRDCTMPHHLVPLTKSEHRLITKLDRFTDQCEKIHAERVALSDEWVIELTDAMRGLILSTGVSPAEWLPDSVRTALETHNTDQAQEAK